MHDIEHMGFRCCESVEHYPGLLFGSVRSLQVLSCIIYYRVMHMSLLSLQTHSTGVVLFQSSVVVFKPIHLSSISNIRLHCTLPVVSYILMSCADVDNTSDEGSRASLSACVCVHWYKLAHCLHRRWSEHVHIGKFTNLSYD